ELKRYIDSIEKGELKEWLNKMRNRAKVAEDVEGLLTGSYQLTADSFRKIKEISQDEERLRLLLAELKEVKPGGPPPQELGKFYDEELDKRARIFYQKLREAQTRYSNALSMAQEERIDFKIDNPARVRSDKEKVLLEIFSQHLGIPNLFK
ncbi:unnamed protein product, partial [marine sediment metagenome]